jgi:predicted PurR-regulated permease PerM
VEPGPRRALLDGVLADIHLMLAHYMRALVLLSATAFAAYSIFLSVLGVHYGILLGALAGALEFIPMIGPLAAGAIVLVIAGAFSGHLLAILIFIAAFRMFQDYLVSPHLMGRGVQLHPLLVLFGVFAGARLAGIPGTFLSVPVLALVRVLYLRICQPAQM